MDKDFFESEKDKYVISGRRVQGLPGPYQIDLPEIYQIEVSSVCNYNCIMCPKELYSREKDEKFIDPKLIELMLTRDEFAGSYFVELQMTGEPLLHPDIQEIIDMVGESGVLVGLSTNGSLLTTDFVDKNLARLSYITISLDSVTKRDFVRKGFKGTYKEWYEKDLKDSIRFLHMQSTQIDIQFIELPGYRDEMVEFIMESVDILDLVTIRTVPEGYFTLVNEGLYPYPDKGMCMNPFLSVSIQSQGHVVPCCFAFGDDYIYGDIKNQTLREIWEGPRVAYLRKAHRYKESLPWMCSRCYMRSPTFLHTNILYQSIRDKKGSWGI